MIFSPKLTPGLRRLYNHNHPPDLLEGLHINQQEVARSASKRKAIICGRRAGKTVMNCRLALQSADAHPDRGDEAITVFAGPTKNHAKRLMWGKLQIAAEQFKRPYKFQSTDLIANNENGSQIWIMGLDDDRDVQRLRGFAYRRVIVDEAQGVTADFADLVEEVIEPSLADFDGDLVLTGTPNASCLGYFHDASVGILPGWSVHSWTILQNPMFPKWRNKPNWEQLAASWLDGVRTRKGWDEFNETYLREYLGRWIRDEGGLVYKYNQALNGFADLPRWDFQHVIGIDLGVNDAFAMVCWAFDPDRGPDVWVRKIFKQSGLTMTDWANHIRAWQAEFDPVASVVDTGGLGKAIVEEMRSRFGLSLKPAEKTHKATNVEILNADFVRGVAHVPRGSAYEHELMLVQWDEDRKKEDPRFSNDVCDAGLYGHVECKHWIHVSNEDRPEMGSKEYWGDVADKLKKQRMREIKRKNKL